MVRRPAPVGVVTDPDHLEVRVALRERFERLGEHAWSARDLGAPESDAFDSDCHVQMRSHRLAGAAIEVG